MVPLLRRMQLGIPDSYWLLMVMSLDSVELSQLSQGLVCLKDFMDQAHDTSLESHQHRSLNGNFEAWFKLGDGFPSRL